MKSRTRRRRKPSNGTPNKAVAMLEPLFNNVPFVEILNEEGVEMIHKASMRLLKEFGTLIVDS